MNPQTDELLDVLDAEGNPTGEVKPRGLVHRDGDWHRTFHLWIVNGDGMVLFQRRALSKQVEPGRIDIAVGGHFGAGEGLNEVLREVEEELGFTPDPRHLERLGTWRTERVYPDLIDREFQEAFLLHRDAPLESYRPDCTEVTVLYELPLKGAIQLYRQGTSLAVAGWDCQGRVNNALLHEADLIERARDGTARVLEQISELLLVP